MGSHHHRHIRIISTKARPKEIIPKIRDRGIVVDVETPTTTQGEEEVDVVMDLEAGEMVNVDNKVSVDDYC
jgi:hypothetical protein